MTDISLIQNLDTKQLKEEVYKKLQSLCNAVYDKPLDQLTPTQVEDILNLEMNSAVMSMNVFCQCTRQVADYSPNVYSLSQNIDLSQSYKYIQEQINCAIDSSTKIERYLDLKTTFYKLISFKYSVTEEFLRALLRESEIKDGVRPLGRFIQ